MIGLIPKLLESLCLLSLLFGSLILSFPVHFPNYLGKHDSNDQEKENNNLSTCPHNKKHWICTQLIPISTVSILKHDYKPTDNRYCDAGHHENFE